MNLWLVASFSKFLFYKMKTFAVPRLRVTKNLLTSVVFFHCFLTLSATTTSLATTTNSVSSTTEIPDAEVALGLQLTINDDLPKAEVYLGTEVDSLVLLSNVSNSDILITSDQVVVSNENGTYFQNVILVCSAEYPIFWTYTGDGSPTRMFSSEIRSFEDFRNESTYEYFTTLVLMQERNNEHLTGTYTCQSVDSPNTQVFYHLFFPGGYGFPTIRNRVVQPPKNDSHVLLPCKATNPTLPMTLYKINPQEEASNLTASEALTYNPRLGFILNMGNLANPYGTYYCSVNDSDSFWKIDLVPRKYEEFNVEPDQEYVPHGNFENQNQTFKCTSKEEIQFDFPNSLAFGDVEYFKNQGNFPYTATFTTRSDFPWSTAYTNYFKIQCMTKKNRRVLHTWEFSGIGPEELAITYNKEQKRILCCSKSGLAPRYDFVKCETVTDCSMKAKCFENGRCEYPFPPNFVDAPPGCTAVEFVERVPTHLMKCSVGDKSRQTSITETIDNDGIILEDGSPPTTDKILKITMLSLRPETNEIKIKCSGSIFFFSTKFVFALEKSNGKLEFPGKDFMENEDSHEPIMRMEVSQDIKNIICFAPLSRSSEWRNATLPVTISAPSSSSTTTTVRANIRSSARRTTQKSELPTSNTI